MSPHNWRFEPFTQTELKFLLRSVKDVYGSDARLRMAQRLVDEINAELKRRET